ncbi:MAG: acyl-CoA thioesterase [Thermoplasmata archaeon]
MAPPIAPEPAAPWPTRRRFYIEYRYLDVLEHLNHAAYFGFMETLRCDYYLPLLSLSLSRSHSSPSHPSQLDIILAEASCRYLATVSYGEEILGEITAARPLGRTSFVLLYRFTRKGGTEVVARGRSVVVCYDYAKSAKKEIPEDRRREMERHAVDPASEGW